MNFRVLFLYVLSVVANTAAHAQSTNSAREDTPLEQARAAIARGYTTSADRALAVVGDDVADINDLDFLRGSVAVLKGDFDSGVAHFRAILARDPSLNRVRLDLAQAYFQKGDDTAAIYHFRAALAQGVPPEVAQNIARFLQQLRSRKKWDASISAAVVPDSNINAATTADSIDVFGLPFTLDPTAQQQSGIGLSVGGAAAYRLPLSEHTRLKLGASYFDTEYINNKFSDRNLGAQIGPSFILSGDDEVAVLASASRRWLFGKTFTNSTGLRLEGQSALSSRWLAAGAVSWENRKYEAPYADYTGPVYTANAALSYALDASSLLQGTAGVVRERANVDALRSWQYIVSTTYFIENLVGRFAVGFGVQAALVRYDAMQVAFGKIRRDKQVDYRVNISNANLDVWGFTPVINLTHADRYSNINLFTYHRNRAELGVRRNF